MNRLIVLEIFRARPARAGRAPPRQVPAARHRARQRPAAPGHERHAARAAGRPAARALAAQPGFAVYRNTVTKGCIDALQANYPTVCALVGEAWFRAAAHHYAQAHPPQDARLTHYGDGFATFLEHFGPAAELPYLADVARLDRCWTDSHLAADAEALDANWLAAQDASTLATMALRPHPAARWHHSPAHPAFALWQAHREGLTLPADIAWQGDGGLHGGEQAVGELAFAVFEGADHGVDNLRVCEHVAGGDALFTRHGVVVTQGLRAAEMRGLAEVVDGGDLPVLTVTVARKYLVQRLGGGQALFQQGEHVGAQGGQGDVLRGHGADTRQQPRAAGAHGDAGGADGDAELAGFGAAGGDGEGHGFAPWSALANGVAGLAPSRAGSLPQGLRGYTIFLYNLSRLW